MSFKEFIKEYWLNLNKEAQKKIQEYIKHDDKLSKLHRQLRYYGNGDGNYLSRLDVPPEVWEQMSDNLEKKVESLKEDLKTPLIQAFNDYLISLLYLKAREKPED
jgi:hypothetical protein